MGRIFVLSEKVSRAYPSRSTAENDAAEATVRSCLGAQEIRIGSRPGPNSCTAKLLRCAAKVPYSQKQPSAAVRARFGSIRA